MHDLLRLFTLSTEPEQRTASMIKLMQRLFNRFEGHVKVQLWDGQCIDLGNQPAPAEGSPFTLVFRTPAILITFLKHRDPLSFAESYFRGEMDIEGDLAALLALREQFARLHIDWRVKTARLINTLNVRWLQAMSLPDWQRSHLLASETVHRHTRSENRASIQFHYDVSNAFYALWLDPAMIYSCAYFSSPAQDLASAQTAKLDLICRKLQLQPEDQFLDIGCGWGALIIHAARHYRVRAHGVTLSQKQYDYAQDQIKKAGLAGRVSIHLQDYRDIPGHAVFNKIASVGMFEHVGIKNLPTYFQSVQRLLTSDGLFLNQGITSDIEGWPNNLGHTFVNRYVFPDGQLDTLSNIQQQMALAQFEVLDVESMRAHYALTLRCWITQLTQQHAAALQYVSEATFRIWLSYMTASRLSFENGHLGLYQILICQRQASPLQLPLTRRHMLIPQRRQPAQLAF
jgi:cyclopropane-fatty-acyl-phospholipid synthase